MTKVVLPRLNQTGVNEWADVQTNDEALQTVINGEIANENLSGAAGITRANLAAESKPLAWSTPKAIVTEESRTNVAYGTLTTADEIGGVVVPENGRLAITYSALIKSSVSEAGRIAIFIGANQLQGPEGGASEVPTVGTTFHRFVTNDTAGIQVISSSEAAFGTTGIILAATEVGRLAAGTYAVSVRYKSSSGSITAKERLLQVEVRGF